MEKKNYKIFDNKTMQAVSAFCLSNNIENVDNFIYRCFKQGFDIERFGLLGNSLNEGEKDLKTDDVDEKHIIKEIIVEKRVEIPVEVIKEVEKIVEIPVEIIKEIEKVVTIYDNNGENELLSKIEQLEEEISKKDKELDELRRNLDQNKINMLQDTLQKLRKEISEKNKKIEDLEKIKTTSNNNAVNAIFMKGSNLKDVL